MVVLGIGKVYKSTFVDIITLLTSSAHARASGEAGGGAVRLVFMAVTMLRVRAVLQCICVQVQRHGVYTFP